MTSHELTSGFDFWSRTHLRVAVMHLPILFDARYRYPVQSYWHFFRNLRWRPPPSWIFSLCEFGHSGVLVVWFCVLNQIWFKYLLWTLRSTHICFRPSFDDVTRINFRFQLLVTWSSLHGLGASSHEIWCRYLYPIRSYWYFSKIKDGGRRHFGIAWVSHGTTHEASFVVRTSCKNFVMIG